MNPSQFIVPIFAVDEEGNIERFLGTGSFVGDPPLLLTADHVVRDCRDVIAVAVFPKLDHLYRASLVVREAASDLALLRVPGYLPPSVLRVLAGQPIHPNQTVVTFEYGPTRTLGREIKVSPATRMGNVTRVFDLTDLYGIAGDEALELSFPALRGASGAPVMTNSDNALLGVIKANISYHLLPAQIETVLREDGEVSEETQFMMPQAIAVNVKHVRRLLDTVPPT